MSERVVIVGAGHAAGQCVASLRQKKYTGDIVLLGEEPWLPYQRPPLSKKFLAGELDAERLHFKPQSFYEGVDVRLNTRVREIDCSRRKVTGAAGDQIDYGWLVLATGGRPRTMQVPGVGLDGIHYLRTIDDVNRIRHDMQKASRLVVVGAGYIGLEVAAVAAGLGLNVTVVEMEGRVMQRVVSPQLSEFYERVHRQHGVQLRLSERTSAFSGDSRLAGVVLESGEEIAADLAIIGIGIVPNT
jgi:3-phenylpropionate/trans-cinnamate dioxygenase ferredoxin reductase subunit